MENPHEQVQSALLSRIINNVDRLNESIQVLNKALDEITTEEMEIETLAQMWETYHRNARFNLEATGNIKDPIL